MIHLAAVGQSDMIRFARSFLWLLLVTAVSLVTISCLAGCTLPEQTGSGFRDREANWGASYRSTNELDQGTGLHHKGREVERSLGYQ